MAENERKDPIPLSRAVCNLVGKSLGRDQRIDKKGNATGLRLIDKKTGKVYGGSTKKALDKQVEALQHHLDCYILSTDQVLLETPNDGQHDDQIRKARQMMAVAARLRQEIDGLNQSNYETHRGGWWYRHFDKLNQLIANEPPEVTAGGEEVLGKIFVKLDKYIDTGRFDTGNATGNSSGAMLPEPSNAMPALLTTAVPDDASSLLCNEVLPPEEDPHVLIQSWMSRELPDLTTQSELAHASASGALPPAPHAMPPPMSDATLAAAAPPPADLAVALGVASEPADRMGVVGGQSTQAHAAASPLLPYMPPPLGISTPATASAAQPVGLPQGTSLETVSPSLLGGAPPATTPATTALAAAKRPRSNPSITAFEQSGQNLAATYDFHRAKLEQEDLCAEQFAESTKMVQVCDELLSKRALYSPQVQMQFRSLGPADTDDLAPPSSCWRSLPSPPLSQVFRSLSIEG